MTDSSGRTEPVAPPTILIIEDDDDFRWQLAEALIREGYAVRTASNGVEGLHGLSTLPLPSLILLDLRLPVMSGVEFLRLQRTYYRWATIPVVVVTGEPGDLGELQARAVLHKPVDWQQVYDTIHLLCPIGGRGEAGGPPPPSSLPPPA